MAKKKATKKTSKKTATKKKPTQRSTHTAFLVRAHPDTKAWLEETAEKQGLSRDGFCRMLFDTARASWDAHDEKAQQRLFDQVQESIEDALYRVIGDLVENAPRNSIEQKLGVRTKKR